MDANELSIDFSESRNNVCLIIGPNGSGKTTLLSLLTPFANLGNLDIRDGNEMILDKKDGYKEIHIRDRENLYVIKHFYSPHEGKSHSTKSYIEKNGVELNVNGNVTSFKEYVKEELGIEPDYLKLIRLGNNVTSMINLSETERKNFMSKLMDEIGVSLAYYKKVNTDLRQLKQMIALDADKLKRLDIEDEIVAESKIEKLKSHIDILQGTRDDITSRISILQHEIARIEDPELLREKISNTTKKLKKMNSILEKKDQLESTDVAYYTEKMAKLEKEKIKLESSIKNTDDLIQTLLTSIDQSEEQYRLVMTQWQKEEQSDKEIEKLRKELNKLEETLANRNVIFDTYKPRYTATEISDFMIFLKNQQNVLNRTYEFGKKAVEKVIDLIRSKTNVVNYVTAGIMDLNDQANEENSLLLTQLNKRYDFSKELPCGRTDCEPIMLWNHIKGLLEDRNIDGEKESYEYYKDIEMVYDNISIVLNSFAEYGSIISRLPDNVKKDFITDTIYKKISSLSSIYNEKKMNDVLAEITEFENIQQIKSQRDDLSDDIARFVKLSNFEYLNSQKEYYENKLEDDRDKLRDLRIAYSSHTENLYDINRSLETLDILKETFEKYDELSALLKTLEDDYDLYRKNLKEMSDAKNNLADCDADIKVSQEKLQVSVNNLSQFKIIRKELNSYESIFDEMTLVKEALSSKKGMPLYHIKHYLGNTEEITNELLDIAYDGEIYIDPFHISPTEFRIPFHIRGKKMKDVKYASQGELSFLSIALSFGLSSQSLSKYNIMLLDEIDGPLDSKNREKFIRVLENQIDRIGSEQNFLITHNNMFSSYPVDIVDLSFNKDHDEYRLANYIPIKLQ